MRFFILLITAAAAGFAGTAVGPAKGSVLAVGGGALGLDVLNRFIGHAGGPEGPIVLIPTANGQDPQPPDLVDANVLGKAGARNVTVLRTTDRKVANSRTFVEPLRKARGVWLGGGRQWRRADAYLNTRTLREVRAALARGGVIGGSSAGAPILGSYLVRGAPQGNQIMMAVGHEQGFGFLGAVAIDQRLLRRKRENDLVPVIAGHPKLLGIGIDERTAVLVQNDCFEVIGASKVAIYETNKPTTFSPPAIALI